MTVEKLGKCDGCGIDLDDVRARGYFGHACHRPPPSYPPKLRLQNVPPALIRGAARALDEDEHVGRKPYDWRGQRTSLMRHVGGIQRHLLAFVDGQDVDPDSPTGKHHLEGIAGRLAILLDAIAHGDFTDDRPAVLEREGDVDDPGLNLGGYRGHMAALVSQLSSTPMRSAAPPVQTEGPGPSPDQSASSGVRVPGDGLSREHAPGCCSRRGPGCDCGVSRPGLNI